MKTLLYLLVFILSINTYSGEKDLYDFLWLDPDKKVYVLQNKVYEKKWRAFVNIGLIRSTSGEFQDTTGFTGKVGLYFHEQYAVEAFFSSYQNSNNDAYTGLGKVNGTIPFIRRPLSNYGVNLTWSPFYGKINTFNKIFYFDWYFSLGIGKLNMESNAETVSDSSTANNYRSESYTSLLTKTGLRLHMTKSLHMDIEFQRNNFKALGVKLPNKAQESSWKGHNDIVISVGLSF